MNHYNLRGISVVHCIFFLLIIYKSIGSQFLWLPSHQFSSKICYTPKICLSFTESFIPVDEKHWFFQNSQRLLSQL